MGRRAPDTLQPADSWQQHGPCREEEPELFFPVGRSAAALHQATQAKAVCRSCPVMDACLEWALDVGVTHGVWGGLDEAERRRAHRGQGPHGGARSTAPCGTRAAYQRHLRHGEDIDEACRAANAAEKAARRSGTAAVAPRRSGPWTGRLLSPCGTRAAYRRHLRHSEEPCEACRDAERRSRNERNARAKQVSA